jgi:hypothetical protein
MRRSVTSGSPALRLWTVPATSQPSSTSRRFGEAGRERIVELYRWERVVDVIEAAIGR